MMLTLFWACGQDSTEIPVALVSSQPQAPDDLDAWDARLASCTVTRRTPDGTDEESWAYDADGRLTRSEQRTTGSDGVSESELAYTWDGLCPVSAVSSSTSASLTLAVEVTTECDEHGSPIFSVTTVDGEDYASYAYVNSYDGDKLVAYDGTLVFGGDLAGSIQGSYGWSGDRWVEYDVSYELAGDGAAFHEEYDVDEHGQVLRQLQQDCSLVGAQECATTLDVQYTYADAHAVGSVRYELEQAEQEDGTWLEVSLATWESLLVSAPSGLPVFRATTSDGGSVVQDAFAVDCG